MSTTGDVLNDAQQAAFERYIKAGGGYAGIHSAADTEYTWPWYGQLVGAYFRNHPAGTPTATVVREDTTDPSTSVLQDRWSAPTSGTTSSRRSIPWSTAAAWTTARVTPPESTCC